MVRYLCNQSPYFDTGSMGNEYIKVDLTKEEKAAILEYAGFFVIDEATKADLTNKRKKWVRFSKPAVSNIIGELSYCFNRCKDNDLFHLLDELICHLENYEQ
ncbi:hypothetical protein ACFL3F_00240 [Planctomycetota bacterium]